MVRVECQTYIHLDRRRVGPSGHACKILNVKVTGTRAASDHEGSHTMDTQDETPAGLCTVHIL